MYEGPDSADVILQLFREGEGASYKVRNPLPQGAIEAFDVVRSATSFTYNLMAFARKDPSLRLPEVGIKDGALSVDSGQRSPEAFSTCAVSITYKDADDLSGRGVEG